jgi:RNA polymerase sigma-70 factor, ECF subfamily
MSTATVASASGEILARDFEDIFREHYQLIYRSAYSVTGSHQDAEDVLQTIFLKLIQRKYPPDLLKNPKAYLHRAAINSALNTIRSRQRQRLADDVESLETPARGAGSDEEHHIQRTLLDAIAQLRPRSVEILILRYEHGYSDAEIAKMLGKSRGTIAVTLYRARGGFSLFRFAQLWKTVQRFGLMVGPEPCWRWQTDRGSRCVHNLNCHFGPRKTVCFST